MALGAPVAGGGIGGGLPQLDVERFVPHPLHASERTWTETNCYVDVWIEVLHALELDPVAAAAFTLSCDFEGDQWTFFKYPPEDLRTLFGIEVAELNVWRPVVDHVEEQLGLGRLCTVEVDAWFLPDTRGISYRVEHVKTTIVPTRIDRGARRLDYFHNAGLFTMADDDFDGVFHLAGPVDPAVLAPYVETVRIDRLRHDPDLVAAVVDLTRVHLARRPSDNPVTRMAARIEADLPWLAEQGIEAFHLYAFGLCRQCGASTELAATFVDWLNAHHRPGTESAAAGLREVAEGAKGLQFALARAASGRTVDLEGVLDSMTVAWGRSMDVLGECYGD
ncbi:MAG TPA: DUF1839 family protein [Acidimicrobiales bacterium]